MDNVIYIILAAAVFIAMAGILLFIGSDTLQETGSDADDIRDNDRPSDWIGNFFESSINGESDLSLNTDVEVQGDFMYG